MSYTIYLVIEVSVILNSQAQTMYSSHSCKVRSLHGIINISECVKLPSVIDAPCQWTPMKQEIKQLWITCFNIYICDCHFQQCIFLTYVTYSCIHTLRLHSGSFWRSKTCITYQELCAHLHWLLQVPTA
jgi:hypothetical protein